VGNSPTNYTDPSGHIPLDTLADVGFILYDLGKILKDNVFGDCNNLGENLGALGADLAGLALPYVAGLGIVSRGANKLDDAVDAAKGLDNVRPPDSPFYEVGFEAQLQRGKDYPGISREKHFQEGNRQLYDAMQSDPDFAQGMENLYPGITEGVQPGARGAYPRRAPTPETTWHHEASREGALQLVPRQQHRAPGPVQGSLHPGGRGGMENWGGR